MRSDVSAAPASWTTSEVSPVPCSAAAAVAPAGKTRFTKSLWPPLSKKPFTDRGKSHQRPPSVGSSAHRFTILGGGSGKKPPNVRVKSAKLVTNTGFPRFVVSPGADPPEGPRSVTPTIPVVLVLTPSIGFGPASTSSTYTPGLKYSGMVYSSQWI